MRKGLRWLIAFVIMFLLGIGVAVATSGYLNAALNPTQFYYSGNEYKETNYELSTNMEHKTSANYLYDFSGHSPDRDLRIPDSLAAAGGKYGRCYQWAFPRDLPINGTDLGILSESFTVEAWLNPQTIGAIASWSGILGVDSRRLLVATNGLVWAQMTEPHIDFFSNVALGVGSWTHVAFVYDSDNGRISWIINGTLDQTSDSGYTSSWNGPFQIGRWTESSSSYYGWAGKIDEFRIRHEALTPSQIADDMNRPIEKTVRVTALVPDTEVLLALENGGIPQEIAADAKGIADFNTFEYGDSFDARFTVLRDDLAIRSEILRLHTGDEYRFSFTSFLSPTLVFISIVVAFPLGTALAYVVKRATSRKPSHKQEP